MRICNRCKSTAPSVILKDLGTGAEVDLCESCNEAFQKFCAENGTKKTYKKRKYTHKIKED